MSTLTPLIITKELGLDKFVATKIFSTESSIVYSLTLSKVFRRFIELIFAKSTVEVLDLIKLYFSNKTFSTSIEFFDSSTFSLLQAINKVTLKKSEKK